MSCQQQPFTCGGRYAELHRAAGSLPLSPPMPTSSTAEAPAPVTPKASIQAQLKHVVISFARFLEQAHGRVVQSLELEAVRDAHATLHLVAVHHVQWAGAQSESQAVSGRCHDEGAKDKPAKGNDQEPATAMQVLSADKLAWEGGGTTRHQMLNRCGSGSLQTQCDAAVLARTCPLLKPAAPPLYGVRLAAMQTCAKQDRPVCSRMREDGPRLQVSTHGLPGVVRELAKELEALREDTLRQHEALEDSRERSAGLERECNVRCLPC